MGSQQSFREFSITAAGAPRSGVAGPPSRSRGLRRTLAATAMLAAAGLGTAACASAARYNPDGLGAAQIAQVEQICQTVMGLAPAERPSWGTMLPVGAHLRNGGSHYQGCVSSLSDSLQRVSAGRAAAQAQAGCRARGLESGTSALALCELQSAAVQPSPAGAAPLASVGSATALPVAAGAFLYASPDELVRREQLACASLGLAPSGSLFARCVRQLRDTFFAIDNPIE